MIWKFSLVTVSLAIGLIFYIYFPSGGWFDRRFSLLENLFLTAVPVSFIFGPYLGFGILAYWIRANRTLSSILLGVIVLLSVVGVACTAVDQTAYLARDKAIEGQRMIPFLIALGEWAAFFVVSLIMLLLFYVAKSKSTPSMADGIQ